MKMKNENEKCLYLNTQEFLYNIFITSFKKISKVHTFSRWVQKAYL